MGEGGLGACCYVPVYRVLPRYPVPSGSGLSVEETPTEGRACIWRLQEGLLLILVLVPSFKCSDLLLPELYLIRGLLDTDFSLFHLPLGPVHLVWESGFSSTLRTLPGLEWPLCTPASHPSATGATTCSCSGQSARSLGTVCHSG